MDILTWDEKFSVGVNKFDDEHKDLIVFINRLNSALIVKSTDKTIEDILTGLMRYTEVHFGHEEELMVSYKYPDYIKHKNEHDSLKKQVSEFYERFKTGKAKFSLELMTFLKDWLVNHIIGSDKKYMDFFNSAGVS